MSHISAFFLPRPIKSHLLKNKTIVRFDGYHERIPPIIVNLITSAQNPSNPSVWEGGWGVPFNAFPERIKHQTSM